MTSLVVGNNTDARSGSTPHRCCSLVEHALLCRCERCDDWLADVCQYAERLNADIQHIQTAVLLPASDGAGWEALACSVHSAKKTKTAAAMLKEARAGFPNDDVLLAGHRDDLLNEPRCAVRKQIIPDDVWATSRLRAFRARHGLHEFALATSPMVTEKGAALFLMQVDGVSAQWRPSNDLLEFLETTTPFVARALHLCLFKCRIQRAQLFKMLTPAQRAVAIHLTAGLSESQIAERLDRSRHTVHDHTKAIYKAWGVRSRSQLHDLCSSNHLLPASVAGEALSLQASSA